MLKNALLASALGLSVYVIGMTDAAVSRGQPMGWYVAVEGGANWIDDSSGDIGFGPIETALDVDFDSGWVVAAEVGYRWVENWRLEFEAGFRQNDVDCVSVGGGPCFALDADISQFSQMINVLYDIPLNDRASLSVGAGFGLDHISVDTPFFQDSDFVVAGQLIAQLNYDIFDDVQLFVSYRYVLSEEPDFRLSPFVDANIENANHTVSVGLRFDLGPDSDSEPVYREPAIAPPMPPLPPEPPLSAKQYVVFFGFNKANLTQKAQTVIAEAAETAKEQGAASILVTGHTDTVGSAGYNQVLSERRAFVVTRELVRLGIPKGAISSIGKGETMLLVQTPDRTWEDRNRRATIDLE